MVNYARFMKKMLLSNCSFRDKVARLVLHAGMLLFCGLLPVTLMAASTIIYVQGNYATPQSPQTTVAVTFNAAQAAGDLNVVVVGWNDSTAVVKSVADTERQHVYARSGPHGGQWFHVAVCLLRQEHCRRCGRSKHSHRDLFERCGVSRHSHP